MYCMEAIFEAKNEDCNWNKILDYITSRYIGFRGVSMDGKMTSMWIEKSIQQEHFTLRNRLSLVNVGLGMKQSTIFQFLFDDIEVIKEICNEISKTDTKIYLNITELNSVEGYNFRLVATNKIESSVKQMKDYSELVKPDVKNIENEKYGEFLGYPKDCCSNNLEEFSSPSSFLDLDEHDIKKLNYLIPYNVKSKKQANEALDKARKRYSRLEKLDEVYGEHVIESNINLYDVEEKEIREKMEDTSFITSIIDDGYIENGRVLFNMGFQFF